MTDVELICRQCGRAFAFPEEQRHHLAKQRLPSPRLCPKCSQAASWPASRKSNVASCATCGKPVDVQFERRHGRAVYCDNCYAQRTQARPGGGRSGDRLG